MKKVFISTVLTFLLLSLTVCSPVTSPTINGYFSAVLLLENDATRVEIYFYSDSSNKVVISRDDPLFSEILQHLKDCSSGRVTLKITTTIQNGITKTVHTTVLYGRDRFLDFILKDGAIMRFNVSDEVWFETDDTIYNAKYYGSAFGDFLETILPRTILD